MASSNVTHQVGGRGLGVPQATAEVPVNRYASDGADGSTTSIVVLSCFISFLIVMSLCVVQRRKHRARLHQQRILMLERLWKISPQKQC